MADDFGIQHWIAANKYAVAANALLNPEDDEQDVELAVAAAAVGALHAQLAQVAATLEAAQPHSPTRTRWLDAIRGTG